MTLHKAIKLLKKIDLGKIELGYFYKVATKDNVVDELTTANKHLLDALRILNHVDLYLTNKD